MTRTNKPKRKVIGSLTGEVWTTRSAKIPRRKLKDGRTETGREIPEGHPEFELSEAILDQAFTVELWYKFSYVGWTDWAPLINISNTEIGSSPASSATGDTYFMAQYGGGNNYYAFHIYSGTGVGGGEINSAADDIGNIIRNTSWNHVAFVKQYKGYCSIYHIGEL